MPSKGDADTLPRAPWGIISVKAQDEDYETPMQVWVPANQDSCICCHHGCCNAYATFKRWLQMMRTILRVIYVMSDTLTGRNSPGT